MDRAGGGPGGPSASADGRNRCGRGRVRRRRRAVPRDGAGAGAGLAPSECRPWRACRCRFVAGARRRHARRGRAGAGAGACRRRRAGGAAATAVRPADVFHPSTDPGGHAVRPRRPAAHGAARAARVGGRAADARAGAGHSCRIGLAARRHYGRRGPWRRRGAGAAAVRRRRRHGLRHRRRSQRRRGRQCRAVASAAFRSRRAPAHADGGRQRGGHRGAAGGHRRRRRRRRGLRRLVAALAAAGRSRPDAGGGRLLRPPRLSFDPTLGYPGEGPSPRRAPAARHRGGARDHAAILTVNANSARPLLDALLPRLSRCGVVLAQEHRQPGTVLHGEAPADRFRQQLAAAGWRSSLTPAYATGRGGFGGGAAVLWSPRLAVAPLGEVFPGRAAAALWSHSRLGDVVLISVYGVCGGGVAANRPLWETLAAFLAEVGKPFVLGGDFNLSPAEVATLVGESSLPAVVCPAGGPTCFAITPAELDFFVVHRRLAAAAGPRVAVRYDLPVAPHRAVELQLAAEAAEAQVPVFDRPRPPPPARRVFGPDWAPPDHVAAWRRLREDAVAWASQVLDATGGLTVAPTDADRDRLDALWSSFLALAGRELSAAVGAPVVLASALRFPVSSLASAVTLARRGTARPMPSRGFAYCRARLLDPRAAVCRHHALPFGALAAGVAAPVALPGDAAPADAAARAHEVVRAALSAARAAWLRTDLAPAGGAGAAFLSKWRWLIRRAARALTATAADAAAAVAAIDAHVAEADAAADDWRRREWRVRSDAWHSFARDALSGSAGPAHRLARLAAPVDAGAGSVADQLAAATASWSAMWRTDIAPPDFSEQRVPVGPPASPDELRAAARTFSARTAAPDGCSPRHFALLGDEGAAAMAALFRLGEIFGVHAVALEQLCIRLIPKRNGGFRPICLFRSVARLHFRLLADRVRVWERAGPASGPAFNNSPGRRILDATWRECVRHAVSGSGAAVEVLLDLAKAFDQVDRDLLWGAGLAYGYPMAVLRVALAAYSWPRRLVSDFGVSSPELRAARGVAAGSPFATFELKLLLLGAVLPLLAARPGIALSVHVDDFTIPVRGSSPPDVVATAVPAVLEVVAALRSVGLSVSPDKTEIVASAPRLAGDVRAALLAGAAARGVPPPLAAGAGPLPPTARKLGVDLDLGDGWAGLPRARVALRPRPPRRRLGVRHPVKAGRLATHALRVARCRRLFGRIRFRRLMYTGLLPAATYAPEFHHFLPGELHALRASVLVSEGLAAPGIAHDAAWAMLPAARDPAHTLRAAPILRLAREAWAARWRPHFPHAVPPDVLAPRELVAVAAAVAGSPPAGPLTALRCALDWFGLDLRGTDLLREGTRWLSLGAASPASVARALADLRDAGCQAWVDARHADAGAPNPLPVSLAVVRAVARTASAEEARVLAHLVGGTTRTFARAARHGSRCDTLCPACGAEDTTAHRVFTCPAGGDPLVDAAGWTREGLPRWPALPLARPGPAPPLWHGWILVRADGSKSFLPTARPPLFRRGSAVYTDGSAVHPGTPWAAAAGAAVQATPRPDWPTGASGATAVYAAVGRAVSAGRPATSYGGEALGLALAAAHLEPPPARDAPAWPDVRLVTDCLNAVRRLTAYRSGPPSADDPWADEFGRISLALRPHAWDVHKTRAHRAREVAAADGDLADWAGNDAADWAADRALRAGHSLGVAAGEPAAAAWRAQRSALRTAVARLVAARRRLGVPPPPRRADAVARRTAACILPEADRHAWRWDPCRRRFRCDGCHRRVHRLPPPANRCLRAHPALSRILAHGAALGHLLHVCAVQGRMAGFLAVCSLCGAHGSECVRRLGTSCPGSLGGRGGSIRAIAAGRHPSCRASWVERSWPAALPARRPALPAGPDTGNPPDPGEAAPSPSLPLPSFPPEPLPGDEWDLEDILAFHGEGLD